MKTAVIVLIVLAGVFLLMLGCCVMAGWWSRKEEQEENCRKCPGNVAGRCDCLRKKENPCATCWEMEYKTCEGCHRRDK